MNKLIIKDEDSAYALLENINNGIMYDSTVLCIDSFPVFNIHIEAEKFHQSITPRIMRGLVELQKSIYQSYATVQYNSPSKRLSEEEKSSLEITINVKGGSSNFDIDVQQIAVEFIKLIGHKMNATQVISLVVSFFVLYFSKSAYNAYLNNKKEIRIKEISDETQRKTLESLQFMNQQETERAKLIISLAGKSHQIENIYKLSDDAHTEITKAICNGEKVSIQGVEVNTSTAELLTRNSRRTSSEVRLDGIYKILRLDCSHTSKYKAKIQNIDHGTELDADIKDDSISFDQKELLQKSLLNRCPIFLSINALVWSDDEYHSAIIIEIKNV
jgi:hypothetical protein